jgi:hypothetical protein
MISNSNLYLGFVKLNLSSEQLEKADRLRIVFHASESTFSSGYANPTYNNQLFGSQRVLWKRKDLQSPLDIQPGSDISLPFIIQLPMVQFPPSANVVSESEGLSYRSNFTLTAYLEQSQGQCILKAHKPIIYMPFIETGISKKPINITTYDKPSSMITQYITSSTSFNLEQPQQGPQASSINLSMNSLDYVLGDAIPLTLSLKNISRNSIDSISVKLAQIQTWNKISGLHKEKPNKASRKLKAIIAQTNVKLPTVIDTSEAKQQEYSFKTCLDIPHDALPTFTYSYVFSIAYVLLVNVKRKGKLWSNTFDLSPVPIKIGTLGYGIRSSQEIRLYSTFKSVFDQQNPDQESSNPSISAAMPVPKFLDMVEYEESLPIYINDRLPAYDTIIESPQYMNGII